jgi:mannose-6-phosphate isomerase-like protein (cupin superfamily)
MRTPGSLNLTSTYLRLRGDASIEPLAADDTFWERLAAGRLGTFHNEYLVTCHVMDADWTVWEMHPRGDEIVCLVSGSVTFILERHGGNQAVELNDAGSYVIIPRGTWHTAKVHGPTRMIFITAGEDTEHRKVGA